MGCGGEWSGVWFGNVGHLGEFGGFLGSGLVARKGQKRVVRKAARYCILLD